LKRKLEEVFSRENVEVIDEWHAFKSEVEGKYAPSVDLAVGPFATGNLRLESEYDALFNAHSKLFGRLVEAYSQEEDFPLETDVNLLNIANRNSRCFVAMEVVHSGSRKHRIGDIVNACSLGRVGIIVAWDESIQRSFFRIARYLNFLAERKKLTYPTTNLIVTTRLILNSVLSTHS
jgi:hypothetical protein